MQFFRAGFRRRLSSATSPGSTMKFSICCKNYNRALCVAETEERVTPDVVTADFCYYRYRKPKYTPEERRRMVRAHSASIWAQGRDVFAYFKHEETPQGALYAVEVLREWRVPRACNACASTGVPALGMAVLFGTCFTTFRSVR